MEMNFFPSMCPACWQVSFGINGNTGFGIFFIDIKSVFLRKVELRDKLLPLVLDFFQTIEDFSQGGKAFVYPAHMNSPVSESF